MWRLNVMWHPGCYPQTEKKEDADKKLGSPNKVLTLVNNNISILAH